jgi:ABC-type Fe3+-citrate transport system substrate-binding protein
MKTQLLITLFVALGLLTACAKFDPHSMDMTQAVHNAKSRADHEALAQHYEDVAKEMQSKVEEHKKILSQYEREPWLFGKQEATGFGVHCKNLIQIYSQAAEENLEMAKMHKQLAEEIKQ